MTSVQGNSDNFVIASTSIEYSVDFKFPKTQDIIRISHPEHPTSKVLLQPFYWLMPDTGTYYNMITESILDFANTGFDAIWLPPPSKTLFGDIATGGYEPYDYYDLGEYDQADRIRTRWGTRNQLENLIDEANKYNIDVIADIVVNHRVGGEMEFNPYVNAMTPTDFTGIASGKLQMNYSHFWPNAYGLGDTKQYGDFPDISHANPEVQSMLYEWGKWLRDEIGFDAFRFDTADGIAPEFLKNWMLNVTDTWGIAELWMREPDRDVMMEYLDNTDNILTTFDHPLMVQIRDMSNFGGSYDMRNLEGAGLVGVRKDQAITFAVNHDTYRDAFNIVENRHMAYAYILTHEGYPSVFWMDYLDMNLHHHLKNLVRIHNQYANGPLTVLHTSDDLYVAQRGGIPGIIIILNDHPTEEKSIVVNTKWQNTEIFDLTNQTDKRTVDSNGDVSLSAPPSGYAIFSTDEPTIDLFDPIKLEEFVVPTTIPRGQRQIDGIFESNWGKPTYMDKFGDSNQLPSDLLNLYTAHDNEHLYLSFGYSNLYLSDEERLIDYGVVIDTKDGGATESPDSFSKVKWAGTGGLKKPDYMYSIETNHLENEYYRTVTSLTKYSYNGNTWDIGTDINTDIVSSSPMLGYIEMKIPLEDLELEYGGEIGIKVFSSLHNSAGARDSVPQDDTISTDGSDSWLFMPTQLIIDTIPTSSSSETKKSNNDDSSIRFSILGFFFTAFILISLLKNSNNNKRF